MILLALAACLSDERIAEEQDAAATAAGDALAASLILAELAAHADDPPATDTTLRHAGECGCPCVDRVGAEDSYVQELDYAQPSCIPWSGLLGTDIGGHVWVDVDRGELGIRRVEANLGGVALEVDATGTWAGDPLAWAATLDGTLDADPVGLAFEGLTLDRANGGLALDGAIGGGAFEAVSWAASPAASSCPRPDTGRFVVDDDTEVVFDVEGATVTWRGHSATYSACELAPPWY